MYLEKTTVS